MSLFKFKFRNDVDSQFFMDEVVKTIPDVRAYFPFKGDGVKKDPEKVYIAVEDTGSFLYDTVTEGKINTIAQKNHGYKLLT